MRAERSVADLAEATANSDTSGTAAETGAGVPCIGDGVSGNRVQAIYAVSADRTDRYAEIATLIPGWAAAVDDVFSHSAAQVGGERHVRFVTDAGCGLDIAHVVLSATGDDNIMNTINELVAAGYGRADRKYLIWMDAAIYCGIAQIFSDDRPGQDNLSNVRSGFARVDQGCWGGTYSSEAHELVHSLGGVQPTAPHASANFHCTDEEDRMCYKDGVDVVLTFDCPIDNAHFLDCNHDDYYHPSPPAGSYLDTHWNVADSSFLHAGPIGGTPPPPTNAPPVVSAAAPASVALGGDASLDGTVSDDGRPGPYTVVWSRASGPGPVTFTNATSEDTTVSFSVAGVYVLRLTADDGELTGDSSLTIIVDPEAPPNAPPVVSAAAPASVTLGNGAPLDGAVSDDGMPGPYAVAWSQAKGPGAATFTNATSEDTTVSFSVAGVYVLTLTADDGELTGDSSVTITVEQAPPPDATSTADVFTGSISRKSPTRTFNTTVAAGPADAVLSLDAARGKKATSLQLTLNVYDAAGNLVGTSTGPSTVTLTMTLEAGPYTWEVTGANTSFSLEVTHMV